MKLTSGELREMREQLEWFRKVMNEVEVSWRMDSCFPFDNANVLFGGERYTTADLPCHKFGRQLVLKIVDELLDDGSED